MILFPSRVAILLLAAVGDMIPDGVVSELTQVLQNDEFKSDDERYLVTRAQYEVLNVFSDRVLNSVLEMRKYILHEDFALQEELEMNPSPIEVLSNSKNELVVAFNNMMFNQI